MLLGQILLVAVAMATGVSPEQLATNRQRYWVARVLITNCHATSASECCYAVKTSANSL
jgi:hypothetical protein